VKHNSRSTIPGEVQPTLHKLKTDDCAKLIDNTVILSTAKWKYTTKVTKFLNAFKFTY